MEKSTLTVGKVRDAHGMKGELYVLLFAGRADWIEKISKIQLSGQAPNKEGKHELAQVDLTIKSFRPHKKGIILKTEELGHRTDAEKLIGFTVELPFEALRSQQGETIFLAEIEGFEVISEDIHRGRIVGFGSNGPQDLLIIDGERGKGEVPFVKELVVEIKWKEKQVIMSLPEGLLP